MALFGKENRLRQAFAKVGEDILELKKSVDSWVIHLNSNQAEMKRKLYELDRRVRELEMEKVREMMK